MTLSDLQSQWLRAGHPELQPSPAFQDRVDSEPLSDDEFDFLCDTVIDSCDAVIEP